MKPQIYKTILAVLVTSALTACSSGSGSDSDTGSQINVIPNTVEDDLPGLVVTGLDGQVAEEVSVKWFVNLTTYRDESQTPGHGYVFAELLEYGQNSMQSFIDFYEPSEPAVGECDILVEESTSTGGSGGDSEGGGSPPSLLYGGESLSIDTPDGVWMTMFSNGAAEPSYETSEDGLLGPIPDNASLTIPGSTSFPGVKLYPIQEPDAPERLLPDITEWASPEDIYSWIPSNKAGETMGLAFYGYDLLTGDYVERIANCIVEDDGNFEMPLDLEAALWEYDGLLGVSYFRRSIRLDLIDDMLIKQRNTVTE